MVDTAGLPGGSISASDGVSLASLLAGSGEPARESVFWHYPHYSNQGGLPGGAIRQGDWKLIEFYEDNRIELYNLAQDPGERSDLAAREPAIANKLRQRLRSWRTAMKAKMPAPDPAPREKAAGPQPQPGTKQ